MSKNEEESYFASKNFNSSQINSTELLKQIEILDSENIQLKEALSELEKDLKEKDQSIEESQKIITKIKEEYTKVIKELQNMEKSYNELLEEVNNKTLEIKNAKKNQSLLNVLKKKNDSLSNEKNNLHKENLIMRKKILSCGNISFKNEKNIKNKDIMIENLQIKNNNLLKLVKEREKVIEEQNMRIKELNNIINSKNEELKIMMNISKEINKENKINVKEITKQAVKTIKAFQNHSHKNKENYADYSKSFLANDKNPLEEFENIFKSKKGSFSLEDALSGVLYIPDNLNNVSKEFLINMNLKTELIKNELFSGLIRETQFINFLEKIFIKMNLKDNKGVQNFFYLLLEFKEKYLNIIKENYKMKKILAGLNNKDVIQKLKENINKNNNIIKIKFIEKQNEIKKLKTEIKNLNNILINSSNSNKISKHVSYNYFDKRIKSPKIWSTLPSLDYTENTEPNQDNSSREIFNKKNIQINRINKKMFQKRVARNKLSIDNFENIQEEIFNNNSLEYNKPFNTENNRSQDLIYFNANNNNNSAISEMKRKKDYQKDISLLQKEINNILMRNPTNKTISLEDEKIKNPMFTKINNKTIKPKKNKVIKEIFSDRIHGKNNNRISILNSQECNTFQNCHISTIISKDSFNSNYKNNSIIDNSKKYKTNNIFTTDYFVNLFFKINNDIFNISELNTYKESYNLTNINNIYLNFEQICNQLKNKIDEINLKIGKSLHLSKSNTFDKSNLRTDRKDYIDTSFKYFNEKIINLKKLEFEFINMSDYIKNYLISQEATIQIMYNMGKKYIKFEAIEKLFNLFEDSLSYRIDEMNENIKFNRKLLIKLFKNQINCLFLSFEYNFN